jgi:hypothetical protein
MLPKLCKAGVQLREQIDDDYPERDRKSDGWIADTRHSTRKSDHNPDPKSGIVRAIDVDADLAAHKEEVFDWSRRFANVLNAEISALHTSFTTSVFAVQH